MNWSRIILSVLFVFSESAVASPEIDKIGEVFLEEFAKEQIKKGLENFLNDHPEVVFSNSKAAGTEALQYVGYALSFYSFLTAKTDKQRFFAAGGAGVSLLAVPHGALIVVAVQLVDLAVSLDHQKNLAKIYEQAKRYELEAFQLEGQVKSQEAKTQQRILNSLLASSAEITKINLALKSDPVVLYLVERTKLGENQDEQIRKLKAPTDAQVMQTFECLSRLHQQLIDYEVHRLLFDGLVYSDSVEPFRKLRNSFDAFEQNLEPTRAAMGSLIESVRLFLASGTAKSELAKVQDKTQAHRDELERYVSCAKAVNRSLTEILLGNDVTLSDEIFLLKEFADECMSHYNWGEWK